MNYNFLLFLSNRMHAMCCVWLSMYIHTSVCLCWRICFGCLISVNLLCSRMIRKNTDQHGTNSSKTPSVYHRGLSEDVNVGSLHYNSGLNAAARNTPTAGISTPVSPQRPTTGEFLDSHVATNSLNGSNNYNRGFTKEASNTEHANYNLRLNILSRSAPTSVFSSPAVSPRRSNAGDLFHSYAASQEFHDGNAGFFAMGSPMKTVHNSPRHNSRSPNRISYHLQHRSLPHTFVERPESNHHVTAHPLPLPPGATAASPSATINHAMESPHVKCQWQKGKLIGRGTFGSVYEATNMYASISMLLLDLSSLELMSI